MSGSSKHRKKKIKPEKSNISLDKLPHPMIQDRTPETKFNLNPSYSLPSSHDSSENQVHITEIRQDIRELKAIVLNIATVCSNLVDASSLILSSLSKQETTLELATDDINELSQFWFSDKSQTVLADKCQVLQIQIATKWQDKLNDRKLHYWHFIQNDKKSQLYTEWLECSPLYLPLKFRPTKLNNEVPAATQQRIEVARGRYRGEIEVLRSYAESHKRKYLDIDQNIDSLISSLTQSAAEIKILNTWWHNDTDRNAHISQQLWSKKRHFLVTQQKQDLEANDYLLKSKDLTRKPRPPPRCDVLQRSRSYLYTVPDPQQPSGQYPISLQSSRYRTCS